MLHDSGKSCPAWTLGEPSRLRRHRDPEKHSPIFCIYSFARFHNHCSISVNSLAGKISYLNRYAGPKGKYWTLNIASSERSARGRLFELVLKEKRIWTESFNRHRRRARKRATARPPRASFLTNHRTSVAGPLHGEALKNEIKRARTAHTRFAAGAEKSGRPSGLRQQVNRRNERS